MPNPRDTLDRFLELAFLITGSGFLRWGSILGNTVSTASAAAAHFIFSLMFDWTHAFHMRFPLVSK